MPRECSPQKAGAVQCVSLSPWPHTHTAPMTWSQGAGGSERDFVIRNAGGFGSTLQKTRKHRDKAGEARSRQRRGLMCPSLPVSWALPKPPDHRQAWSRPPPACGARCARALPTAISNLIRHPAVLTPRKRALASGQRRCCSRGGSQRAAPPAQPRAESALWGVMGTEDDAECLPPGTQQVVSKWWPQLL